MTSRRFIATLTARVCTGTMGPTVLVKSAWAIVAAVVGTTNQAHLIYDGLNLLHISGFHFLHLLDQLWDKIGICSNVG